MAAYRKDRDGKGRFWIAAFLSGVLFGPLPACGPPAPPPLSTPADLRARSSLEIEPDRLEFPPIPFGSAARSEFHLRNRSAQPVTITRIGPTGCDCALLDLVLPSRPAGQRTLRLDPRGIHLVLKPGEKAVLGLVLDTSRYREPVSRKIGSFPLYLEGEPPLVLEFAADIWTPYWVEPWSVDLGPVGVRQRARAVFGVRSHDDTRFNLVAPGEIDGWKLKTRKVSGEKEASAWRIEVTTPEELPQGPFSKEFRIHSDLPGGPPIRFAVQGVAGPDVLAKPKRVILLRGDGPADEATVEIQARAWKSRVEILGAEIEGDLQGDLEVSWKTLIPQQRFEVTLRARGPAPASPRRGILHVRTTDADIPRLDVPVSVVSRFGPPNGSR